MKRFLIPAALVASLLLSAPSAVASGGITPLSPKKNATVPVGSAPTFKMRVRGAGSVWVHVCKNNKRNGDGVICHKEAIGQAKKKNGLFQYKADFFDFPEFWLNSPGTYYWQAHRINCEGDVNDCRQESAIVKFKVG